MGCGGVHGQLDPDAGEHRPATHQRGSVVTDPPGLLVPLDSFTSVEKRVEKKISSQFLSNLLIKCAEMKEELFFLSVMLIITFPFPAVLLFINHNMFIYSSFHLRMLAATCSKYLS